MDQVTEYFPNGQGADTQPEDREMLTQNNPENCCSAVESQWSFSCTRVLGHEGAHEAGNVDFKIVARWS